MGSHHLRYLLIFGTLILLIIALVVCGALGIKDETTLGAIVGAIAVLVPAMIDAKMVESRRKISGEKPVADDVQL